MLLDLRGFRGEADRVARTFAPEAFALAGEEFRITAPVEFAAEVRKDAQKARLVGRIQTRLEVHCGRCLEPFAIDVDAPFDLMFLPLAEPAPEAARPVRADRPARGARDDDAAAPEQEVQDDDFGVSYYKDDVIDLGEVMREQFYLALPMKPLCRPDCRGLCPVCGGNRNADQCACRNEWVDPRMAPLKKLLD